jgi:tetratricopeptide (TPR) repeat protein
MGNNISQKLQLVTLMLACFVGLGLLSGCNEDESVYQPAVAKLIEKANTYKNTSQLPLAICRLEAAADLAPQTYQVHFNLGVLYSENHQFQEAIGALTKAIELSPQSANGYYTLAYAYENLGTEYETVAQAALPKDIDPTTVSTAIRQMPKPEAQRKAAESYEKAIQNYQAYLKLAPSGDPNRADAEGQVQALQQKAFPSMQ